LALVRRLAGRHDVIATGRREPGKVRDLFPESVHYVRADQSDPKAAAQALGRGLLEHNVTKLDHVVLNAATGHASAPQDETPDTLRDTLDVNLAGTLAMAHILYSWLRRGNGQLTLIGSTARKGAPQFACYAASKAGLHGLARALEEEWRGTVPRRDSASRPDHDRHAGKGRPQAWLGAQMVHPPGRHGGDDRGCDPCRKDAANPFFHAISVGCRGAGKDDPLTATGKALVTGGNAGLGRAFCAALCDEGYAVTTLDQTAPDGLRAMDPSHVRPVGPCETRRRDRQSCRRGPIRRPLS
jgi:NAD(P)-dependent dehydrogenase (short-subunit alcohol dehydrogenase family)